MSLLHKETYDCVVSDLDLTATPLTQTSIEGATIVEHIPVASLTHGAPIEFVSYGAGDHYRDLSDMHLGLKCRVKKNRNDDLDASCNVAIINYLINSLFCQVDITLNGKKITPSVATHSWRSIFEVLLNFGKEAKSTHLETSGFKKDTAHKLDNIDNQNAGYVGRKITNSKPFELFGKLHTDICFQNRYIINKVDMTVKLIRNNSNFCLIGDGKSNYELFIDEAILYIRHVIVSAPVMLEPAMALEKATIKYPLNRVECVQHTLNGGILTQTFDNISSGIIPKRLVFGLVESDAAIGSYTKNPFNFKHFNMAQVSLTINQQDAPNSPLNVNFSDNNWIRAYYNMFSGLDRAGLDWGNDITKDDFIGGYGLYIFDLSPDKCFGDHFNVLKSGNLKLKLTFRETLPCVVNLYIYMEYDNMMEITKNRNVIFDYTV